MSEQTGAPVPQKLYNAVEGPNGTDFYFYNNPPFGGTPSFAFQVKDKGLTPELMDTMWDLYLKGRNDGVQMGRKNLQAEFKRMMEN